MAADAVHASSDDESGSPTVETTRAPTKGEDKIRVLLADDHRAVLQALLSLLLREEDIEVVGLVYDGEMACQMAVRTHPDVVLMDVAMPQVSGIEATRRIMAVLPGTRVIGFSNYDDEVLAQAMWSAGAEAYLTKAGSIDDVVAAIRGEWETDG